MHAVLSAGLRRRLRLVAPLAAVAALLPGLAGVTPAQAAANTDRLTRNEQLNPGQRLISPNGLYVLAMQDDGNLVEYAPGNRAVWASNTFVRGSIVRMQDDGNLVIIAPGNRAVWATGTSGNPGAQVEMQQDGNVVVYGQGHVARWASGVPGASSSLADRVVAIARAQEANASRKYERGGYNCNFYSGEFDAGSRCSNGWHSQEWCADFARWVWREAGARHDGLDGRAMTFAKGYAGTTWRPSPSAAGARVGDAVVFNYNNKDYASHVAIVVGVGNGQITVVEGNAGPSTDRVYIRTFTPNANSSRSSERVSGYASPVQR